MTSHTLNLSQDESDVLGKLSVQKGMSKSAVLRQALKTYQLLQRADYVDVRIGTQRVYMTNPSDIKVLL